MRSCLIALLIACPTVAFAETNWPGWRGPHRTGHTEERDIPVRWNDSDVAWKTELIGAGQSSPVVWGNRVFLTSATDEGRSRVVMCLDRESGKLLWDKVAWTGTPESSHQMNRFASPTCVTDGQHVVAFFGRGGIHCYDFDGKLIWSRDLGQFEGPWGTGASPLLVGNRVVVNCDAENDASVIALDIKSGQTAWKTPRLKHRGWSSPIAIDVGDRTEIVLNGDQGVNGYDADSGKDLWFVQGGRGRGTPTITRYNDRLIVLSGRTGAGALCSLLPGDAEDREVWRVDRPRGRDLGSPIVVGDWIVAVSMRPGIATCYDAATGKELDQTRLAGSFCASPVSAGGLIYVPNVSGEVFVVKPGPKLEIVAKNELTVSDEETFRASLTPHNGQVLCRSDRTLYCIGPSAVE